jgi:hypothetical protein
MVCFKIQKIGFLSHIILLILNTKKLESHSHSNWFQTYLPQITYSN